MNKSMNTSKLHFVKVPENHIVIDFDIPDEISKENYKMVNCRHYYRNFNMGCEKIMQSHEKLD